MNGTGGALSADSGAGGDSGADAGTDGGGSDFKPRLLIDLGDECNTPDGMRKDPKSMDIILSCPNFFGKTADGGFTSPPKLMKLTPANRLEPYFSDLPASPVSPGRAGPMGLDFGPDGNLYVADHQYRYSTDYKSRIIRVNVDANGRPTTADVVVIGTRLSNAVMWSKDYLYLTDTWAYDGADQGKSLIYRFSKAELAMATTASPIQVARPSLAAEGGTPDPHLFAKFTTIPGRGVNLAGADGITFDAQGNLYTGNFGDGIITKITFDASGNLATQTEFVKDSNMTCADGIFFDSKTSQIYVTDSQKNAIRVISPTGALTTLWENDNTDGTDGLLDQPAEPIIRGDELILANFDAGFGAPPQNEAGVATQTAGKNTMSDPPHTLSVIKLR